MSDKVIKLSLQLDASPPHVQESFVVAGCLIQLVESPKGRTSFLVCKESAKGKYQSPVPYDESDAKIKSPHASMLFVLQITKGLRYK